MNYIKSLLNNSLTDYCPSEKSLQNMNRSRLALQQEMFKLLTKHLKEHICILKIANCIEKTERGPIFHLR